MPDLVIALRRLLANELIALVLLLGAIQGTVLASQLVASTFVDPVAFGEIRTFESAFAIAVLLAGFGAPGLALRDLAAARGDKVQEASQLTILLLLPVLGALLVSMILAVAYASGAIPAEINMTSVMLIPVLLCLVNATRLLSAVGQAVRVAPSLAAPVIIGGTLCVICQVAGAWLATPEAWLWGRVSGEALLLSAVFYGLSPHLPRLGSGPLAIADFLIALGRSLLVNIGLITRMAADAMPILLLGYSISLAAATSPVQAEVWRIALGHFGLATLFLTLGLLPISVVCQRAIPLLAMAKGDCERQTIMRTVLRQVSALAAGSAILVATGMWLVQPYIEPQSTALLLIVVSVLPAILFKGVAAALGGSLLAEGRLAMPTFVNLAEIIVIGMVFACTARPHDVWTAVSATLLGGFISLAGLLMARRDGVRT